MPIDQLASRVASAVCDNISGCCQTASFAFDESGCKQYVITQIQKDIAENTRPSIHYDASAAGRCVAAYASVAKSCVFEDEDLAACDAMFVGTLPAGAACMESTECAGASGGQGFCDFSTVDSTTTTGVCAAENGSAPHGKQGDACIGSCSGSDCSGGSTGTSDTTVLTICYASDGLYCSSSNVCQPVLALGESCQSGDMCQTGAYCDSTQRLCAPALPNGASCGSSADCASTHCLVTDTGALSSGVCGNERVASASVCSGAAD